jgi:DNA-binding NarL/FixJ family response regulator
MAIDAGAWGFISKSDGVESLLDAVRRISNGECVID